MPKIYDTTRRLNKKEVLDKLLVESLKKRDSAREEVLKSQEYSRMMCRAARSRLKKYGPAVSAKVLPDGVDHGL